MKPRELLGASKSRDGQPLEWVRHDGHLQLESDGTFLASSRQGHAGEELGRLVASPLRKVRQPRLLLVGLKLGQELEAMREALPQERARFLALTESAELSGWLRGQGLGGDLDDPRVELLAQSPLGPLPQKEGPFHGMVVDFDYLKALAGPGNSWDPGRQRWLHQALDTIKTQGLLGILSDRLDSQLEKNLRRLPTQVSYELVSITPTSKRCRALYLVRKMPPRS